jgi:hypothetical protein
MCKGDRTQIKKDQEELLIGNRHVKIVKLTSKMSALDTFHELGPQTTNSTFIVLLPGFSLWYNNAFLEGRGPFEIEVNDAVYIKFCIS